MKRRKQRSASEWLTIVESFQNSDLSIEQFCENQNLGLSNFKKWQSRFDQEKSLSNFVPIQAEAVNLSPSDQVDNKAFELKINNWLKISVQWC